LQDSKLDDDIARAKYQKEYKTYLATITKKIEAKE